MQDHISMLSNDERNSRSSPLSSSRTRCPTPSQAGAPRSNVLAKIFGSLPIPPFILNIVRICMGTYISWIFLFWRSGNGSLLYSHTPPQTRWMDGFVSRKLNGSLGKHKPRPPDHHLPHSPPLLLSPSSPPRSPPQLVASTGCVPTAGERPCSDA